jgi:hypothetical protein
MVYKMAIPTGGSDEPPVCYLPVAQNWKHVLVGLLEHPLSDWFWGGTDEEIEGANSEVAKWVDYLEECVGMFREVQGFTFFDCKVLAANGMGWAANANQMDNGYWYTTTPVNGEPLFAAWALLQAGTYSLEIAHVKGSSHGKHRWYVDGVANDSAYDVDMYAAATTYNQVTSKPITIPGDGVHSIMLVNVGKHASSTGYYVSMNALRLIQTGA